MTDYRNPPEGPEACRDLRVPRLAGLAMLLGLTLLLPSCQRRAPIARLCRPVDSAWAISVHVTDSVSGRPVANAVTYGGMTPVETDSTGWLCIRNLSQDAESLSFDRRGYRSDSIILKGVSGQVVSHELRLVRVSPPCCDLRGQWRIVFRLDSAGQFHPRPPARTATGGVNLGPRYLPAEPGDDLDSLVRVVRGLHQVDFAPFFGGPVARDVSTTIFGNGPDLVREVMASVPQGDSVAITFIPRMSHGSLSLRGRIRSDTIRGTWVQNAYCCGGPGEFVMTRTGPVDTVSPPGTKPRVDAPFHRILRTGLPPATVPAGQAPESRWRPELAVAPGGRLWVANGGLFVADSFGGAWRRVLGGEADPVEADELRIGIQMAFVGTQTAIVGLDSRYPVDPAPVLYRTDDAGSSWSAVVLDNVREVDAVGAIGPSVWVAARRREGNSEALFQSPDAGKSWVAMPVPESLRDVTLMHRVSTSTAYLATSNQKGRPVFWRTTDAGVHWQSLSTPSDEGLHRLDESDTRVEQIATMGGWLLVREHGRVFASADSSIRWRQLEGIEAIASEPGGDKVFVLLDSLRPAFLDTDLRMAWKGDRRLPIPQNNYIEEPVFRYGVAYVPEGQGSIHQIRQDALRVARPASEGRRSTTGVTTIILPVKP